MKQTDFGKTFLYAVDWYYRPETKHKFFKIDSEESKFIWQCKQRNYLGCKIACKLGAIVGKTMRFIA